MPGMGTGLNNGNPTIVSAFHRTLLHETLIVVLILSLTALAWHLLRLRRFRLTGPGNLAVPRTPEAPGRRLVRLSFGMLWILDGLLQTQSSMPLGMVPGVLRPGAATSPAWVQHLINAPASVWSYHPVSIAAAVVWVQVGLGLWLLSSASGWWSRSAGVASAGWGVLVWIFGEAFGQVLAPGATWLLGAPGAALFYAIAGALLALPPRAWTSDRLGRLMVRSSGVFFVGMAVLQAWPGRGFWQGHARIGASGTLASMTRTMAETPQPRVLASLVGAFARLDAAHGSAVNLFAVAALGVVGLMLATGRGRLLRLAVLGAIALCLADWIFVEDLGFLGGVGTDPNSMIPMLLLVVAGYLAMTRVPTDLVASQPIRRPWKERLILDPVWTIRLLGATGAVAVTLVGAAPMALAAVNPTADPVLSQAMNGIPQSSGPVAAPDFHLIDQAGQPVTLTSFHGKTLVVTFLDDVCTSTCPIIAQEFKAADGLLGHASSKVVFIAINTNPRFLTPDYLRAFDHQEGMSNVANWRYLTAPALGQLEATWHTFGLTVQYLPGGSMIDHDEFAEIIGPAGRIRYLLNADPGPGSSATQSSFSATLAETIRIVTSH